MARYIHVIALDYTSRTNNNRANLLLGISCSFIFEPNLFNFQRTQREFQERLQRQQRIRRAQREAAFAQATAGEKI